MPTIYELITAPEVAAYFNARADQRAPYLGQELFPDKKQLGMDLKWIKGSKGNPVVLSPASFDTKAKLRNRIGFDRISAEMPFFREALMVDERTRQDLNLVLQTQNQMMIDTVLGNIFDDVTSLAEGAAAQRERMRMQLLTTGAIAISANGKEYDYDYQVPANHKIEAGTSWSDPAADIIGDIKRGKQVVLRDTGDTVKRALCSSKTWGYFLKNSMIMKSVYPYSNSDVNLEDDVIKNYLKRALAIDVVVYDKMYTDESGQSHQYVPDDTFVMFPEGALGSTWFGTTPEESDLMASSIANVSIVDTGVAITTIQHAIPVTVETVVTELCMPSFEQADKIVILDVIKA